MATPAIQTLLSDAQQVLNLNSISEVRSTMAVALANANVGTPLSPSLTTQQLWDEFYQVVRQPESDIESILANQLMKFLYSPPAPGGVGADKQVIFNDGGVLAGSANFLFNKATNLLTVTASATITGALTVDTSTLKVDATNHRVGIGTASPGDTLDVNGRVTALRYLSSSSNAALPSFAVSAGNGAYNSGTNEIGFSINSTSAMTLNSTGLGVGVTPAAGDGSGVFKAAGTGVGITNTRLGLDVREITSGNAAGIWLGAMNNENTGVIGSRTASGNIAFQTFNGASWGERMRIDYLGNVSIGGFAPSAWVSYQKAIDFGGAGNYGSVSSRTDFSSFATNCYFNGTSWIYKNTYPAYSYEHTGGVHKWNTAPSGTAGNAITFTQAMTLDASGNLLVAATSTSLTTGTGLKILQNSGVTTVGAVGSSSSDVDTTYRLYSSTASAYRFYVGYGGTVYATNTTISAISDARLKENVQDIDVGLGAILALKPRKFDWKAGKGKDIKGDRGFIAQEFEQVFPQLVDEWADTAPEGETPYKSVRQDLIPVLVKAIQELTARVQTLETR